MCQIDRGGKGGDMKAPCFFFFFLGAVGAGGFA